jgi:hypothetical protein
MNRRLFLKGLLGLGLASIAPIKAEQKRPNFDLAKAADTVLGIKRNPCLDLTTSKCSKAKLLYYANGYGASPATIAKIRAGGWK